jgi:hypothetical protein
MFMMHGAAEAPELEDARLAAAAGPAAGEAGGMLEVGVDGRARPADAGPGGVGAGAEADVGATAEPTAAAAAAAAAAGVNRAVRA